MNNAHDVPEARVIRKRGGVVTVECPLCGNEHTHEMGVAKGYQRRAPGCGMVRTGDQRLNGYWFITK